MQRSAENSAAQIIKSLFEPDRTFSLLFHHVVSCSPFPLCFSLLHLSFQTHSPSVRFLQLVHISNPHFVRTPPSLHPVSPSYSLLYLPSISACCGWPWGLLRAKGSMSILTHSYNVSHLLITVSKLLFTLITPPPSPSPYAPWLLCQCFPPTFPASSPKPTTTSSNLYSSLSLITSSCSPCGWRT